MKITLLKSILVADTDTVATPSGANVDVDDNKGEQLIVMGYAEKQAKDPANKMADEPANKTKTK